MRIQITGNKSPIIAIVTCIHGDEIAGMQALEHIHADCTLIKIIANEEAMPAKRFIETDGNRVFPGSLAGTHEEKIAAILVPILAKADYVIDLHTTQSQTKPFTIVTKHKELADFCPLDTVVVMSPAIASGKALIDFCKGMSLEFAHTTSPTVISDITNKTITNIIHQKRIKPANSFEVYGRLSDKSFVGKNFEQVTYKTETFYPVLHGERTYIDMVCLKAKRL